MDLASSLAVIGWFVQVLFDKGMNFAIDHWGGAGAGPNFGEAFERLREELNKVRELLPIAQKIRSENEGLLEYVKDLKDAVYDSEDIISELEYYRLQEMVEGKAMRSLSSSTKTAKKKAGGFLLSLTNEDIQASTSSPPPSVVDNKVHTSHAGWNEGVIDDELYEAIFNNVRLHKMVEGKAMRSLSSSMKTAKKKAGGFLSQLFLTNKDSQASTFEVDRFTSVRSTIAQKIRSENEMVEGKAMRSLSSSMKIAKKKAGGFLSLTNEDIQASTSSPPPSVTIIDRIKEVVARLDRIITGVRRLLPLLKLEEDLHVSPGDRVTTSFVSPKQIMFGSEETKAEIIDLLLNGQPADVCVLPIIGVGGIGKTTLARAVYKNKQVVEHFDCTLWLYVSENFDVPRLTREMLESLGVPECSHIKNLDQLQKLLTEKLRSNKFLLVMDDVWNDTDSRKWDMLCAPLEFGKPGSRILLTTRLDTVVRMVGKTIDVLGCSIKLKGLPEKELLSLFNKCAFGNEEPSDHPDLAKIGKQIAGKLGGSPLAAKTVGSLLNEKLNVEHWRSILSSDIWKLPQCPDDIMPVLKLSYQHLPVQLQLCFAYCCVFPKGGYFNGLQLVRMWIAHGYIDAKTSGTKSMEDIGWEYFKTLSARSFFEDLGDDYGVHDLFHDLAQSVSADECFIIDTNNQEVPRRVRHLSLSSDHITLVLQKSYLSNLRTLIVTRGIRPLHVDAEKLFAELLNGLKSVRVIYIRHTDLQQLPHNMGHLIHLRYLSADNYYKEVWRVPDSLGRLYQLQYVYITSTSPLPGIEKLTRLQQLDRFFIEGGRKIGGLKNLKQLGGKLALENLENVHTKEEALEAELSKKVHIRHLRLKCNDSHTSPEVAEEVFEGLRPPAYIKELYIKGYGGVNSPTWMVNEIQFLSNLESLDLSNCLKWKVLPPLDQFPSLKHLRIWNAAAVEAIDTKGFPCLETLDFVNMPQLVVWSGIGEDHGFLFPRLHKLTIEHCPKLVQVPRMDLTSLTKLKTSIMPILLHPENLSSLKALTICACEELQSLPVLPTSLEELRIGHCPQLLTLFTTEQAKTMSKLRTLYIISCPRLMSAELKSLPSLKRVWIQSCIRLPSLPLLPAIVFRCSQT